MLLQTAVLPAVQKQLNQPIPPKQKEQLSQLQIAIDHKSVDVYLQSNFTVPELLQICEICHLRPPSHDKDVLIRHIEQKMIKKNQRSILEIIEYVLSSANMTYHILGNTLTGLSVVVSSSVMVSMLNKLFRTDTSIFPSGSSGPDSSSNTSSKTTKKATNMVFLVSLIFIASKNMPSMLKVMPNLRKHMKMHRDTLKDQKEVFRDTQDSIRRHRQLRANLKKVKRTERVKRLSYAIHEVKRQKRSRFHPSKSPTSKKKPSVRKRMGKALTRKK